MTESVHPEGVAARATSRLDGADAYGAGRMDSATPSSKDAQAARPHAVVFDFDGTLADTFPRLAALMPRMARELRFRDPGPDGLQALRELSMRQILSYLEIPWWKVPLVLWRARSLLKAEGDDIELFPGIADLLGALDAAGMEWGILTTNGLDVVRTTLRRAGAPEPGWLETGLGLSAKSRRLKRMANVLGVTMDRLLLVADEVRDVEAARNAGVPMIGVAWGYNTREALERAGVDRVVESVARLRRALIGEEAEAGSASPAEAR